MRTVRRRFAFIHRQVVRSDILNRAANSVTVNSCCLGYAVILPLWARIVDRSNRAYTDYSASKQLDAAANVSSTPAGACQICRDDRLEILFMNFDEGEPMAAKKQLTVEVCQLDLRHLRRKGLLIPG